MLFRSREEEKKNKKPEASPGLDINLKKELAANIVKLRETLNGNHDFKPEVFVSKTVSAEIPAEVTNLVLTELIKYSDSIDNFWGYALHILKREGGNYHYSQNLKKHLDMKKLEIASTKNILGGINDENSI